MGGVLSRGLRSLAFRGQQPLLRALDHPHILFPSLGAHHIGHDLQRLVVSHSRYLVDQRFHVVDLEGQFVQLVLLGRKLLLLLGEDEVLFFQISAIAVIRFFLQFQPMPF